MNSQNNLQTNLSIQAEAESQYQGIDVSSYEGTVDWEQAAKGGISFAILRSVTAGLEIDSEFENNYKGCRANGLATGIYVFSYALTPQEAVSEASAAVNLMAGRDLELPIFLDMEWKRQRELGTQAVTAIARTFLDTVTNNTTYQAGIYCDQDWYDNVLDTNALSCPFWIAKYTGTPDPAEKPMAKNLIAWQYTSLGSVPGVEGSVDRNIGYTEDFAPIPQKPKTGQWVQESDGRWWYREPDGGYPASQWKLIAKKWYYFDAEGYMATGLTQVDGESYYLCAEKNSDEGACMITDAEGALHVWIVE